MRNSPGFLGLALAFSLLVSVGCSSVRKLDLDSKPPGATIFVDGERKGTTRATIEIVFGSSGRARLELVKPHYKTAVQELAVEDFPDEVTKKVVELEAE